MALDEKLLEELKQKNGKVYVVTIPATDYDDELDVVVKRPSKPEWKRFRSMIFDDAQKPEATETLARACIVHPPLAEFASLLDERPALAEKIGGVVQELAGGGGDATAKKI